MISNWKAWTPATTKEKAALVAARLVNVLGGKALQFEPYPKTRGHVMTFTVELAASTWADAVLALLVMAQQVGRQWTLYGAVETEPEFLTNSVSLSGISMLTCRIQREGQAH